jgi:hypothetical protein
MDGINFREICQGDHFFERGTYLNVVAWIAPTFVDGYTQNFGKSVIVKAWMGLIFRKIYQGDHFLGRGT